MQYLDIFIREDSDELKGRRENGKTILHIVGIFSPRQIIPFRNRCV